MAIRTWACDETRAIFLGGRSRLVPASVLTRSHRKLLILHAATDLRDLRAPPSNRLEKLRGVCFRWRDGDAYQVEIVDYHR